MLKLGSVKQQALFVKVLKHHRIGFLYEYACVRCFGSHITFAVNKLYERQVILSADLSVIFTECRSNMNNTCTVCQRYIVVAYYIIALLVLFFTYLNGTVE